MTKSAGIKAARYKARTATGLEPLAASEQEPGAPVAEIVEHERPCEVDRRAEPLLPSRRQVFGGVQHQVAVRFEGGDDETALRLGWAVQDAVANGQVLPARG